MSEYSIAEAKDELPNLIDRALNGEAVVITRNGEAVIELKPVSLNPARGAGRPDIEWLRCRLAGLPRATIDAGRLVSEMRDEEWQR